MNESLGNFAKKFLESENTPEVKKPDFERAAQVAKAAAAAAILATGSPTEAAAKEPTAVEIQVHQHDRAVLQSLLDDIARAKPTTGKTEKNTVTSEELSCLARNVFHEARGEDFQGQIAVALVTLSRALDPRWSNSICGVAYQRNQFSWTREKQFLDQKPTPELEQIQSRFADLIAGQKYEDAQALLAILAGFNEPVYYYKRTDWDENNPQETRMSEKSKKMWRKLKKLPPIPGSAHTFYTD